MTAAQKSKEERDKSFCARLPLWGCIRDRPASCAADRSGLWIKDVSSLSSLAKLSNFVKHLISILAHIFVQASVRGGAPLASPGPASAAGGHSRQVPRLAFFYGHHLEQ